MRVSTNSIFDGNASRMSDLQGKLDKVSQQVSSGRRILTPSDDPVGAAQALEVQQSSAINTQYGKNRVYVQNTLGVVDGTLSNISDTLQNIHEQVIGAGSGVLSDTERSFYASALKGQFDQLIGLANTHDGNGHYLFAGTQNSVPPFAQNVDGSVSYKGNTEDQLVQVDTSRNMSMTVNGQSLFPGNSSGETIFATLKQAIDALQTPGSDVTQALTKLGQSFEGTLKNVGISQAAVGIRQQEIDSLNNLGSDKDLQYSQTLSNLQDLDYNKSLSDLSRQQLILQATQKTFAQTSQLSLFNYIS